MPGDLDSLFGLKHWKAVQDSQKFGASHLRHFLPSDPYTLETVGEVYHLVEFPMDAMSKGATLSSNRYLPPKLERDPEKMIHRLLSMFHPKPFVYSRFAPQGSVAVIRAMSQRFVDVMFR